MEKEFKMSENKVTELYKYLGELPFKYSNTIIGFLNNNLKEIKNEKKVQKR